jgi:hypothetical protein
MKDRNLWVYDVETIASIFTYVAVNTITEETVEYVIHKDKDDSIAFKKHLNSVKGLIGFNNIGFDYPVIHLFLTEHFVNAKKTVEALYEKAQDIINHQIHGVGFNPHNIWESDMLIQQLDLFKIWHYNNKARMTSLKALEISMNFPNVMDMPIDHTSLDVTLKDIPEILEYNLNDVMATLEFYRRSDAKIQLRKDLKEKYGLKCLNYSDTKIGEELMLKLYCEKTLPEGVKLWEYRKEVKAKRTTRNGIWLNESTFDYIKFKSEKFNTLLDKLNKTVVYNTKGDLKESVIYRGFKYDYGSGGIHGCIKAGVYSEDDLYTIIDIDVASLYPSIAIVNGLYPEHLGEIFPTIYNEDIVVPRLAAKKSGDKVMADGLKLSANSVYGKSNDKYSWLYDPKYTMDTTINGQLMLTMLSETIVDHISDLTMIQINTDGLTVRMLRSDEDKLLTICKDWEKDTDLILEYVKYSKMVIGDVNNYAAMTTDDKCKYKGRFEIDKMVGGEKAYHKNNSFRIIPLALSNYFFKGIAVEDTIRNHKEIYDFCGRQKFVGKDIGEIHRVNKDNKIEIIKQQKNTRYYISTNGDSFMKHYNKGSYQKIHWGYKCTIFNKFVDQDDYNVNYDWYIQQTNKEINQIEDLQLEMF